MKVLLCHQVKSKVYETVVASEEEIAVSIRETTIV